jgi:hypothetical protein
MPNYYFHLLNDFDAPDEEGLELPDLETARHQAQCLARFTLAETIKDKGGYNPEHRINIEDERGEVLDTVRFGDAVKIER